MDASREVMAAGAAGVACDGASTAVQRVGGISQQAQGAAKMGPVYFPAQQTLATGARCDLPGRLFEADKACEQHRMPDSRSYVDEGSISQRVGFPTSVLMTRILAYSPDAIVKGQRRSIGRKAG